MTSKQKEQAVTDGNRPIMVRPLQRKDGSWCAEVIRPYVPATHIGSFKTESEVQDWIIHNSGQYFRKCGPQ
jgi:hypothetical protein